MRKIFATMTLAAASVSFAALLAASPAQAAVHHSDPAAQAQHYAMCLQLLLTDPAQHAKLCGPGHAWTSAADVGGGGGAKPKKTTTKTEEPCEPPPCEPPPCFPCPPPCGEVVSEAARFSVSTTSDNTQHHRHHRR